MTCTSQQHRRYSAVCLFVCLSVCPWLDPALPAVLCNSLCTSSFMLTSCFHIMECTGQNQCFVDLARWRNQSDVKQRRRLRSYGDATGGYVAVDDCRLVLNSSVISLSVCLSVCLSVGHVCEPCKDG